LLLLALRVRCTQAVERFPGGVTSRLTRVAEYRFPSANGRIASAETGLLPGIETNGAPLLDRRLELDIEDHGNPAAAWLDQGLRGIAEVKSAYPPPVPIGWKKRQGENVER
jgi:hypothetical protein